MAVLFTAKVPAGLLHHFYLLDRRIVDADTALVCS
jgi:hypothetical protein